MNFKFVVVIYIPGDRNEKIPDAVLVVCADDDADIRS